jgi:hypothetical protein
MSDRERWVVYPLLFLALGASLRDKLFDRTSSRVIVCQDLQVNGLSEINGALRVNGTVQAQEFGLLPGGDWQSFLRGLQNAINEAVSPRASERSADPVPRE